MVDSKRIWPVDGHVHFHELDLVAPMLDAAAANFRAIGGDSPRLLGALLLAQARTEAVFELLEGEVHCGRLEVVLVAGGAGNTDRAARRSNDRDRLRPAGAR